MIDAIAIGASGMKAQQQVVETLSANIANVSTPGYKRVEPHLMASGFSSVLSEDTESGQFSNTAPGVRFDAPRRSMNTGQLKKTDRALDLAIRGNGFFPLTRPDGSMVYGRNGDFRLDNDGYIVDTNGYRLDPDIQISLEAKEVHIAGDGTVTVKMGERMETVGQIELATFSAPDQLAYQSGGVYLQTQASGEAMRSAAGSEGSGLLAQGFQETSNVAIVDEFVSLVIAQRAYEASSKMVQAADEMAGLINNLIRG